MQQMLAAMVWARWHALYKAPFASYKDNHTYDDIAISVTIIILVYDA